MSVEENKANARRAVEEVMNKGNLQLAEELIADNYVCHQPGMPDLKGPEGFRQFMVMFRTAFPDIHLTIEDMIAEGDKVVTCYTARGTHKGDMLGIAATGKSVTVTGDVISRHAADGKQVEVWINLDMLGMMQQIGAIPSQ